MATIRDVARAAGVSISSVSRVLNGTAPISPAVRQVVLNAARDLQYRPNALARSLITGRTNAIGLIVSDITNPYYGEMLHGLDRRLSRAGYEILLCNSNYDQAREHAFVQSLLLRRVDAVVLSLGHSTPELVAELRNHKVPVVVHWLPGELPEVDAIGMNFAPGLDALAEHLIGLGHRRFGVLTGPAGLLTADARRDAFLQAAVQRGIDPADIQCIESRFSMEAARRAIRAMLTRPSEQTPTALVAGNDLMAFGAMQALREAGLQVPRDMSVTGFDDVALARAMNPPLTTVRSYSYRVSVITARLLLQRLNQGTDARPAAQQVVLPSHLVIRGSTAVAPPVRSLRVG